MLGKPNQPEKVILLNNIYAKYMHTNLYAFIQRRIYTRTDRSLYRHLYIKAFHFL